MRKSHVAIILAVLVAGAIGWAALARDEPSAPPVVTKAEQGSVVVTVLASGMLEATQLVSVGARVSGQVETLAVALGQQVSEGDLIAQIDSQDQKNTLLQAKASLVNINAQIAAKEATLARARSTLTRQKQLGEKKILSQEAVESAAADVLVYSAEQNALRAQKSSAEVTVSAAEVALERTRITAPKSGTIVAVLVKQGQTVNASQAAPTIVKIADLSTMLVKAEISEADVMNVAKGQSVTFTTLGAEDTPFHAVVRGIEPAPTEIADSDTISSSSAIYYNGLLEVANPDGKLRIGMTAEVSIELARADGVLTVPSAALKKDATGTYVEVYDAATHASSRRDVTVGLNNRVSAEIRTGLSKGESVVTGTAVTAAKTTSSDRMGPPPMF